MKALCLRGHPRNSATTYKSGHCKKCAKLRQTPYINTRSLERRVYERDYWRRRKYGVSPEEYKLKFMQQQGKCLICTESARGLVIDHNHCTGKVRGLLCGHCNALLGFAKDSAELLRIAAGYLDSYKEEK